MSGPPLPNHQIARISCSFFLASSSTLAMNLSVAFWMASWPRRSSSCETFLSLAIALSLSVASRVGIRNARQEANDQLKAMAKDKKVSQDDERRGHDAIQKATDKFIAKVEELAKKKEQEILAI